MPRDESGLTPKQRRFVDEYLIDLNATQAAIRAGYSAKTANEIGCINLTKASIQAEIEKAKRIRANRVEIKQDDVLLRLANIAYQDPGELVEWSGSEVVMLKDSNSLTPLQRARVQSIAKTKEGIRVTFYSAMDALKLLGDHIGLFKQMEGEIDLTAEAPRLVFNFGKGAGKTNSKAEKDEEKEEG